MEEALGPDFELTFFIIFSTGLQAMTRMIKNAQHDRKNKKIKKNKKKSISNKTEQPSCTTHARMIHNEQCHRAGEPVLVSHFY